jgi:hypothetical protein
MYHCIASRSIQNNEVTGSLRLVFSWSWEIKTIWGSTQQNKRFFVKSDVHLKLLMWAQIANRSLHSRKVVQQVFTLDAASNITLPLVSPPSVPVPIRKRLLEILGRALGNDLISDGLIAVSWTLKSHIISNQYHVQCSHSLRRINFFHHCCSEMRSTFGQTISPLFRAHRKSCSIIQL